MRDARRFRAVGESLEDRSLPSTFGWPSGPSPTTPIDRNDGYSVARHAQDLKQVQSGDAGQVVFLGDSITDNWDNWGRAGVATWDAQVAPLGAVDFGVVGDSTQSLLWRIEDGELAGQPRVVVLMIGTNNLTIGNTVDQTIVGVAVEVAAIRRASPGSQILLEGLLPRGSGVSDPKTQQVEQVNAGLAGLAADPAVHFMDFGGDFLAPDGSIASYLMPDKLHPSAAGYAVWADAILGPVEALLGSTPSSPANVPAPSPAPTPRPSQAPAPAPTPAPDPASAVGPDSIPIAPAPLLLIAPTADPAVPSVAEPADLVKVRKDHASSSSPTVSLA